MKLASIFAAALASIFLFGCSNSPAPTNSYPLQLIAAADTIGLSSAIFRFQVTKNGAALAGAKLRQTDAPSGQTFDLGIKSDSSGFFPTITVILSDTLSAVAYQATRDTLSSNFIRWP